MRAVLLLSLTSVLLSVACSQAEATPVAPTPQTPSQAPAPAPAPAAPAPAPAPAAPAPAPAPAAAAPAVAAQPIDDVLGGYDAVQKKLAADDANVADDAKRIAAAAQLLIKDAKWLTMADVAKHADAVARAPKGDIKAARLAFADLSRAFVTLLVADPSLRAGRFLFECPMAPAYKRWVQTTDALRNPYYGKEMLECGSKETDWKV